MTKTITITCDSCKKEMLHQELGYNDEMLPGGYTLMANIAGRYIFNFCTFTCLQEWVENK